MPGPPADGSGGRAGRPLASPGACDGGRRSVWAVGPLPGPTVRPGADTHAGSAPGSCGIYDCRWRHGAGFPTARLIRSIICAPMAGASAWGGSFRGGPARWPVTGVFRIRPLLGRCRSSLRGRTHRIFAAWRVFFSVVIGAVFRPAACFSMVMNRLRPGGVAVVRGFLLAYGMGATRGVAANNPFMGPRRSATGQGDRRSMFGAAVRDETAARPSSGPSWRNSEDVPRKRRDDGPVPCVHCHGRATDSVYSVELGRFVRVCGKCRDVVVSGGRPVPDPVNDPLADDDYDDVENDPYLRRLNGERDGDGRGGSGRGAGHADGGRTHSRNRGGHGGNGAPNGRGGNRNGGGRGESGDSVNGGRRGSDGRRSDGRRGGRGGRGRANGGARHDGR